MNIVERALDSSILFSFDRSGYVRHRRAFDDLDLAVSMKGKVCLVTGANSGLGFAVAEGLAERGAAVHLLCRNEHRGEEARKKIVSETGNPNAALHKVDMSDPYSIRAFAKQLEADQVDVLVHNAGLLPLERELTKEGHELTVATHVVGPFLLTKLLIPKLVRARVIVVSSGGMYSKRLDLDAMLDQRGEYDGVSAYAMTKRAQVVLSELWAEELHKSGAVVNATHPGWAATPGVRTSLPRFWRVMGSRLRTPKEGADTALWLAVAPEAAKHTGRFWFDRKQVPTHLVRWTKETESDRRGLWQWCEEATQESAS